MLCGAEAASDLLPATGARKRYIVSLGNECMGNEVWGMNDRGLIGGGLACFWVPGRIGMPRHVLATISYILHCFPETLATCICALC